jgi:metal-dependent HD superfamily phosphatase/phosphodiesterase
MLTLSRAKNHPQILEFIHQTSLALKALQYTEHGLRHANLVAGRAFELAKQVGLPVRLRELSAIAGFCHDMGNFLGRTQHHYWGALLFHQIFNDENPHEVSLITQAISNHDKEEMNFSNPISAIVVLADKSDVHRSRVLVKSKEKIRADIHDRVNFAVKDSKLEVDKKRKMIILKLKIDTRFCPIMEYFEIFTNRMTYCRKAARYLGFKFSLIINNFKLL